MSTLDDKAGRDLDSGIKDLSLGDNKGEQEKVSG